ncbi:MULTISPECIES: aldehyde dehydrogenase [Agrobacterium]|jgi:acyl-CoA reductase-like NAD-dependent aldehyde dehydrogenase|uniref:aldehyde dehydrogenase n=1 Tax=Agrobacterium TaxID=357 RepID=UPI00080F7ECD|nr:aldehyde dehydrogenase [Agrobacterium sp. 13-2099-1-2]NSY46452.1 aldehyde dehydrogenase [Agrobacterium tumefaciens]NSZ76913.1 aldehyde dehydrogenase [Agrobacterium tumefaciens]UZX45302.1 aldehyde dehydrogenase [Agrobacterium sp. 13-2099-1-2]
MKTELIIDNIPRPAENGATFERRHPVSQEVVTTGAAASVNDAIAAAESAARAFASWSVTGPSTRRAILLKAADILEQKLPEFCEVMAAEVGSSELWARFNVLGSAALFREAAGLATQIQGETLPTDKPGTLSLTIRQAAGVVLSIAPWNGPILLGARAMAYPIVCGNPVIFKASENSPRTHALLASSLYEAGLPAGVLNFITIAPKDSGPVTEVLIAHPAVRRVNFTGSTRVGRVIAETSARYLKRCLLELGGKAPFVVLDDADLDGAVNAAVFGAFLYQGQICMSTERFVVDEKIADAFVARFAERAKALVAKDPMQASDSVVGPILNAASGERINAMLQDAVDKGAVIAAGGEANGAMMDATIVDHVKPGMTIYGEETFGPITTVVRVRDIEEAVRVANDTDYGLSAAVFSNNINRAISVATRIQAGCVHVNGATVQNEAQAPYGGMKNSGYGRFDGRAVIEEFTEIKWVTLEDPTQAYPF